MIMIEHKSSTFSSGNQPYSIDRYAEKGGRTKRPVVVLLHGVDGLGTQSGAQIRQFAEQIAGEGFLVIVPHYFDARDGADTQPLPALFDQRLPRLALYPPRIAAAVDFAVKEADAKPGHLGLVGLSLGGGLALDYALSAKTGTVTALVDFFGHISDPKIFANAGRLPPTLILHNKADKIVVIETSSQPLLDELKKTTVIHDHCFYDDVNPIARHHPFLPGGHADVDSRSRSVRWLKTHLMGSS
jgi:dienelactone hydrolase